jgi:hypothetical protein
MTPLRFHPVTQLKELLGPKPNHPWAILLPQILLWSFRRFCVEKLTYGGTVPLSDQLWDDHFDLIHTYAPKGLETVAMEWFTPENIERISSSLEDYNRFFIDCVVAIDESLEKDDEELQDELSEFLDVTIIRVLQGWLEGDFPQFFLFPLTEEEDDEFKDTQLLALIQALVTFSETPAEVEPDPPASATTAPAPADLPPSLPIPSSEPVAPPLPLPEEIPAPAPAPAPSNPSSDSVQPSSPSQPPPPPPPPKSFAEALATRRRTLCNRPRDRSTRGKTRRIPPRA